MLKELLKNLLHQLWVLYGFIGWQVRLNSPEKLTIVITYYKPARIKHINHQIRNLLKCQFVERIVISNHNPDFKIEDFVKVSDPRLVFVNHPERHGAGNRWLVAGKFPLQHLIVMDDDLLLFPWQVRALFLALLAQPESPHGFAGLVHQPDGAMRYHQKEDLQVDYLCEIYAVNQHQLQKYLQFCQQIADNPAATQWVEETGDFVVISRTGSQKPKIHYAGHVLRCPTFNQAGVAVHKRNTFQEDLQAGLEYLQKMPS